MDSPDLVYVPSNATEEYHIKFDVNLDEAELGIKRLADSKPTERFFLTTTLLKAGTCFVVNKFLDENPAFQGKILVIGPEGSDHLAAHRYADFWAAASKVSGLTVSLCFVPL